MEKRTAILFSGSAYNIKFSLDSLFKNIVIPNNADVFVVTTRRCKRRKTVASSPIPDCDVDWDAYSKKNAETILDRTDLTDEELKLIRDTFGDRLKALHVFEEMPDYYNHVLGERQKMKDAVNSYIDEGIEKGLTLPFGGQRIHSPDTGSIAYTTDQYNHVKKCYEFMEQYENENHFKYDYVMRMRIDFKAKEEINVEHYLLNHDEPYLYVMGSVRRDPFEWSDEFCWFSKRHMATILFPNLDRIGLITDRKYNTVYEPQDNDFRFSPETQFSLLLRELDIPIINVRIYRSAEYTNGGDGYDYFNYRFRRDPIDLAYEYHLVCECKTDINEHLPKLKEYAEKCDHVTELGSRFCNSAIAFMAARPKKFITYDLCYNAKIDYLKLIAKECNINLDFRLETVTECEIEETDLLFIDTNHHCDQAEIELKMHANKARKYLIFHDTTTFWEKGQGYESGHGLRYAIEPFLETHPEWKVIYRAENNNGLMIMERIK